MTPEGKVKLEVKKVLNKFNVHYIMPVQNGLGSPTLDFHCCFHGLYFAIETKAPGRKPTPRQERTIAEIRNAPCYGKVFVIDGKTGYVELENWLVWQSMCNQRERKNASLTRT